MSLTSRIIAIGLVGLAVLGFVLVKGTEWAADTLADRNTDSYLSAYADILVPAIQMKAGIADIDRNATLVAEIPRDWQINQGDNPRQRSRRLKSWIPTHPRSDSDLRYRFNDSDGREVVALQRDYVFPGDGVVTVVFGIDASLADAYVAKQRIDLRKNLRPLFYGSALLALLLLFCLVAVVIWPLRILRADIVELDEGRSRRLSERYPVELRVLTKKLNAQLQRHETSLQRYRQFASNLSHAIKTPLTSLRLQQNSPEARANLDVIDAIVERNLARVRIAGPGTTATAKVKVEPLLSALARSYRKISSTSIDLHVTPDLTFGGDAQDFVEAVGNVLENACRYAQTAVEVSASTGQINVADDGPGISPDMRAEVLQRGTRLDQADSGAGIGLAIANEIAESYGGAVELDDRQAGGLQVSILLPSLG